MYVPNSKKSVPLSSKCVCPCSRLLGPRHDNNSFASLPKFHLCKSHVYKCHTGFIEHLCSFWLDYYHHILLRLVQSTYSALLSKLKIPTTIEYTENTHKFGIIHRGHISLPPYIKSSSKHQVFVIALRGISIALSRTNILKRNANREFVSLFLETSFSTTLDKFIHCGQYNKTKKRTTPMYSFGSTITCTRYPKFFADGKTQILPRPYQQSKPKNMGYNIIESSWMQSFMKEVEHQV